MTLSIIVNHHQTPDLLKKCLWSIRKNAARPNDKEIIVVDSESDSAVVSEFKKFFPEVKFVSFDRNVGYGASNNAGLKQARGKYLLIINADVLVTPDSVGKMIIYLENNPPVGLIGPRLFNFDGTVQKSCFRFYTPLVILARRTPFGRTKIGRKINNWFQMDDEDLNSRPVAADWLMGSALLARRRALEKVGFFDEIFFMYFEDVDWCRRFWKNGYRVVYFPGAVFYHYHAKASEKLGLADAIFNFYARNHIMSALKYFWKWGIGYPEFKK